MTSTRILLAAAMLASTSATVASAGNFVLPTEPKIKVTKAQLAIKSPKVNACPTQAEMAGWIFTNKPGKIHYMMVREGGVVTGPFELESKEGAAGVYMASFHKTLNIHHKTDTSYRILVGEKYGTALSNWANLKASCTIQLGGQDELQGG